MCFSVNVNLVKEEIEERYGVNFPDKYRYEPSYYYHASGLPEIPVLCSGDPGIVSILKWGLIPSWVKTEAEADEIRYKTFNARAETIDTKPSFSSSFISRRCIIPVKGFFEWQHVGREKIPWYIYSSENEIFAIAGIWSEWVRSSTGEVLRTFSIITTDANDLMAEIHNSKKRMPAILSKSEEKRWIDLSLTSSDAFQMLKPCPSDQLKAHTISPLVSNKSANKNTPEVIKPYNYQSDNLLF
ncbi:MAG: SOS response-associated peptidase [Bacteroidales bacterium]|jgi:putative SOS response-associated peptidase YedK|nr:SOS response-associated peptidase [Bacteroidales bacterium]